METYKKMIIDGNNLLFRAFFSKTPQRFHSQKNIDTAPIKQVLMMLKSLTKTYKPDQVYMTWDKRLDSDGHNFRKDYISYKEHRVENDDVKRLLGSIEHIQKFIDALGIKTIYPLSTEADDVIRFLSIQDDEPVIIISSDKDLLQLVSDNVSVFLPSKKIIVNKKNFERTVGVELHKYVLYKSILGDVSDNVLGLFRYGPVKSKSLVDLIYDAGTIDFSKAKLTKEQIEIIERNIIITDLTKTEEYAPKEYISYKEQLLTSSEYDPDALKSLFKEYNFPTLLNCMGEWSTLFSKNNQEIDLLSCISM